MAPKRQRVERQKKEPGDLPNVWQRCIYSRTEAARKRALSFVVQVDRPPSQAPSLSLVPLGRLSKCHRSEREVKSSSIFLWGWPHTDAGPRGRSLSRSLLRSNLTLGTSDAAIRDSWFVDGKIWNRALCVISTEGALRRPMTYNHPIHPSTYCINASMHWRRRLMN